MKNTKVNKQRQMTRGNKKITNPLRKQITKLEEIN